MVNDSTPEPRGEPTGAFPALRAEDDRIDFRQLFDLLLSGKWIVLATTLIGIAFGIAYVSIATPVYEADGLVQVEEDKKGGASAGSELSSLLLGTPVQTEAEIQILKSRMIIDQVIDRMNLLVSVSPSYFPYIGAAYARWHQDAALPVPAPFGLNRYAWGGERVSVSTLEVGDELINKRLTLRATADGYDLLYPSDRSFMSGKVGEPAIGQSGNAKVSIFVKELVARPGSTFSVVRFARPGVQKSVGSGLSVSERGRSSGVIAIGFKGSDPKYVADVVNSIEVAYLRQNVERRSAEAAQSLIFLEKQLPLLRGQVDAAQSRLNAYQLAHGSVDVTKETELLLQQSVALETSRLTLAQKREEALQRFTPDHPSVKAIDEQIRSTAAEQGRQKVTAQKLPTTQQDILSLKRDLEVSNQLYTEMLNSVQQLQVAKAGTVGNVRIVDTAFRPSSPSSPRKKVITSMAAFIGFFIGLIFIVIQVALLRGVDDPAEVESRLGLSVYAAIPYSSSQRDIAQLLGSGKKAAILASADPKDLAIEALRGLRNSLHFLMLETTNNVVMLTGPSPNLGKSFISMNLGAVLALSDKTVAVVDADLRKGRLHKYSNLDASPGVSEFVTSKADLETVLRPTTVPGLTLVTNGATPPNPGELLLHEKFVELINLLSERFDYVIVDTPPVLPVADSAIVGRLAGCTLMVLKAAQHPMREIEETYRRLLQAGVNVRGTIFNQVGRRVGTYGYGGYGYSYNHYYRYK